MTPVGKHGDQVFGNPPFGQDFFIEGFIPDLGAPPANPFLLSPIRVDLPDPPGIPVTGRSNQDVWMGVANPKVIEI
jgi:hypothetical protein